MTPVKSTIKAMQLLPVNVGICVCTRFLSYASTNRNANICQPSRAGDFHLVDGELLEKELVFYDCVLEHTAPSHGWYKKLNRYRTKRRDVRD